MKNSRKLVTLFLVLFSFSFFLASCAEIFDGNSSSTAEKKKPPKKNSDVIEVSDDDTPTENKARGKKLRSTTPPIKYRISDLPVPDNYKLDEDKSFIFETETLKTGILVYNGGSDITDIVDFYKEEMPKHGWQLIHIFQHQEANILFDKENWTCQVNVKGSWSSNTLSLTIAPKDPGSAPPPNQFK